MKRGGLGAEKNHHHQQFVGRAQGGRRLQRPLICVAGRQQCGTNFIWFRSCFLCPWVSPLTIHNGAELLFSFFLSNYIPI